MISPGFPFHYPASLGQVSSGRPDPPAYGEIEVLRLSDGPHTHTHTQKKKKMNLAHPTSSFNPCWILMSASSSTESLGAEGLALAPESVSKGTMGNPTLFLI